MTPERYRELLTAGPEITAEDRERLKNFVPKRKAIAEAVEGAFNRMEYEAWIAHTKQNRSSEK